MKTRNHFDIVRCSHTGAARSEPVKDGAKTIRCRGHLKLVRFTPNGRGYRYKIVLDTRVHRRPAREKCGCCLWSRKYCIRRPFAHGLLSWLFYDIDLVSEGQSPMPR